MKLIEVLRNLMAQEEPNEEVLKIVVENINNYLPDEKKFSLEELPSVISLLSFMTLLPDQTKYNLYMTEIDISGLSLSNIQLPESEKDSGAKAFLGLIALIISVAAMYLETGEIRVEDIKDLIALFLSY